MARTALAYSQPRPTQISTAHLVGGTPAWDNILRVPYGDLPSGTSGDYSVIAFGHCGRFVPVDRNNQSRFALTALRFDLGPTTSAIGETVTRVPMNALNESLQIYEEGAGVRANRGHPWCIVRNFPSGSWPATTDLVVCATIEYTGGTSHGTFWCDATTILVFDHSKYTVVHATNSTQRTLPYYDVAELLAVDGGTMPSTGRWLCFYSTQIAPSRISVNPPTQVHQSWLSRLADGVNVDATYGISGQAQITGIASRIWEQSPPPHIIAPHQQLYSMGGWYPMDVANGTTKAQVRAWSYFHSATTDLRAELYSASMFAVREDAFTDSNSDSNTIIPNSFNRSAWTNYQTLNTDCGDDRPQFVAIGMSSMYDGTQTGINVGANFLNLNGYPASKHYVNAINTSIVVNGVDHAPNYASHIADVSPFIVRYGSNSAQLNGILSQTAQFGADSSGRFYSMFCFTPRDDADRTPPAPRVITYTAITVNGEIDVASLPQLTDDMMPDQAVAISFETGLTSFETEDGHIIRWPAWSRPRRAWRLRWVCDEGKYNSIFAVLYRPYDSAAVQMPPSWPESPGQIVYIQPGTLRAGQLAGRLAWDLSCIATEVVSP